MKRSLSSESSYRFLKRANSSLFSIATVVEDSDNDLVERERKRSSIGSNLNLVGIGERVVKCDLEAGVCAPVPRRPLSAVSISSSYPALAGTEDSDTASSNGFFIDDGDDDSMDEPDTTTTVKSTRFLPTSCEPTVGADHSAASADRSLLNSGNRLHLPVTETGSVANGVRSGASKESNDHRTGIVFEAGDSHFDKKNRYHKERPLRVKSIRDYLSTSSHNFKDRCCVFENFKEDGDVNPERKFLVDGDYLRVHLPGYMERLDRLSNCSCCKRLDREAEQFKSIYFTPDTVSEAKSAAMSLCQLVGEVVGGKLDNGFAIIRPPGHHAEPGLAGGYCFINNVAVAAAYARERLGMKKVLIVDWDVHHGNGTQSIFINDPNVLYFSSHRYHGGNFFPFLKNAGPTTVGEGKGKGYNVNIGWNKKGMGDDEYVAVWEKVLMPIANEFQPDLVLISAGFDAADGDLGDCHVTPKCFGRLTRRLMTLAGGNVVCALEGGYVRSILCKCVESVLLALLDRNSPKISSEDLEKMLLKTAGQDILDFVDESAARSIRETISAHQMYWSCLDEESNN